MPKKVVSLPVRREYLNKEECRREAQRILREGQIEGMSETEIAQEIYFHAVVYYYCERTGLFPEYKKHADPIDICDGGDTAFRQIAFAAAWILKQEEKS